MEQTLKFSGHESFICRTFWPKKGVDFIIEGNEFNKEEAVIDLGVGKNMVASISFWLKAIGLLEKDGSISQLAVVLFNNENGHDQYVEDIGTIWLLHYQLIKNGFASIYSLFFNEFRKERSEFTLEQLNNFLKRKCLLVNKNLYNENTINRDISVFIRNYLKPDYKSLKGEFEDEISGLFKELRLFEKLTFRGIEKKTHELYSIESSYRNDLPAQILLFTILDQNPKITNITFKELETGMNSPGLVFALNPNGLHQKIKELEELYDEVVFKEDAGKSVLSFKNEIDKWDVLRDYYAN